MLFGFINLCFSSFSFSANADLLTVLGINAGMDIKTAENLIKKRGYSCSNFINTLMCGSTKGIITLNPNQTYTFNCKTYGGCGNKFTKVVSFFEKKLKIKINNFELVGKNNPIPSMCGIGKKGDKICITNEKSSGPYIYLSKNRLGSSGMSIK